MIELTVGEKLKLTATVQYSGPGWNQGLVYAALGIKGLTGFDEKAYCGPFAVSLPDTPSLTTFELAQGLLIITATAACVGTGLEVYLKYYNLPSGIADMYWYGPDDDINVLGAQNFQNLTVTYQKV
jgi:hypothetical protein